MGGLSGWWFSKLKSIWLGVVAHSINNTLAFFSMLAISKSEPPAATHLSWSFDFGMLLIGALLLFAGIRSCQRALNRVPPPLL